MNLHLKLENILFLDIETVPQEASWDNVSRPHKTQNTFLNRKQHINVKKRLLLKTSTNELEFGLSLVK